MIAILAMYPSKDCFFKGPDFIWAKSMLCLVRKLDVEGKWGNDRV
jgi:hypothetical protein